MECDYCDDIYCITCLNMSAQVYKYHTESNDIWICTMCMPKVKEAIKIEKDIEKRCNDHYEKFNERCKRIEGQCKDLEDKLNEKCSVEQVEQIIENKIKTQIEAEIKKTTINTNIQGNVEEIVENTVNTKIAENEKEIADRKNRENNIILYNLKEPNTLIKTERETADRDLITTMLNQLQIETEEEYTIDRVIRLGAKHAQPEENPRPARVILSNLEAKKQILKNWYKFKESNDELVKKIALSNDLTPKDRQKEKDLVQEKHQKNLKVETGWKYIIRGQPGDRKLVIIRA